MAEETMQGDRGDAKAQPSGSKGDKPVAAEPGEIKVTSGSAEQGPGKLNPSAPGETGTTTKMKAWTGLRTA